MRIVVKEAAPERLEIVLKPNHAVLFAAGLLLMGVGGVTVWLLGNQRELEVAGGELRYEVRFFGQLLRREIVVPVGDITGVDLLLVEGFSPSYEVNVETDTGGIVIPFAFADGDEKQEIADRTLAAVRAEGGIFAHAEDGLVAAALLGGSCLIGGLVCWFSMQVILVVGDGRAGQLRIVRRRTLLPGGESLVFARESIRGIEAEASTLEARGQVVTSYQVRVRLAGGEKVPIAHGPMFTEKGAQELVGRLGDWLGLEAGGVGGGRHR